MAGVLDTDLAQRPHHCDLPQLLEFGPPRGDRGAPTIVRPWPRGTRYHCDGCTLVHIVVWQPGLDGRHGGGYSPGGLMWRVERRGERRKRLGLRWWQR